MTREQVFKIVEPAILAAFPETGRVLARTVERALLGMYEPDHTRPHCVSCGLPQLPQAFKLCRRCIRIAHGVVVGWRVGKEPPGWETALADVKRALRAADHAKGDEALAILERRMGGGFDPTPSRGTCVVCGLRENARRRFVTGPRRSVCADCVERLHRSARGTDR